MAIPVARVHLKVAHAALPALLPTPPKWKILPTHGVAAILPKPLANAKPRDSDERWDAHKAKPPAFPAFSASSPSSGPRSAYIVKSSAAGHGSPRKNVTSPPPMPGRANSADRWDTHKKAAILASSSSSSGMSSLASSSKSPISRASSAVFWDVHKKRGSPQAELLDHGESTSTGSNDMDTDEEEEEIVWKPRAMYAGPGFAVAAPQPSVLPMPTAAFLVSVA